MASVPAESELGPAMKALNDKQRAFVMAQVNMGVNVNNAECARLAGYSRDPNQSKIRGYELINNPRIQAAIKEVGRSRLTGLTMTATALLGEAMKAEKVIVSKNGVEGSEPDWKVRLAAANSILDRGGLHALSEHHVTVEHHKTREEKIKEVVQLAKMLGKDPKELIGNLVDVLPDEVKVIDGEAVVIEQQGESDGVAREESTAGHES